MLEYLLSVRHIELFKFDVVTYCSVHHHPENPDRDFCSEYAGKTFGSRLTAESRFFLFVVDFFLSIAWASEC